MWYKKPSALVPCHRKCHCSHPYPHPQWNRGPDLHVVEELSRLLYSLSISLNTVCFILKIILIFKKSGQENGETSNHDKIGLLLISISHIPPPPPPWGLSFSSCPWRFNKIAFSTEDFHKIWVYLMKNRGLPLKNMHGSIHPQRISSFFTLPLKKSSIFITYPWGILLVLNGGIRILM